MTVVKCGKYGSTKLQILYVFVRAVARALIGGGVYSYIRVLKSVVFKLISKEISRA